MSKTVDQKVVEMRFDNKNFEQNVKKSITTLDKLKSALKLDGATKAFDDIQRRADSLKFNGLANTVENLADKFSGLSMVGTLAMYRIANAAANAGVNMVKSLSVDNIMAGWSKLQQKANSMSTLISQGYDTKVVEEQLEKLNWFSDETSYNFTDMIDNIAKFTATGQSLEGSVTAMQGIALWAAKSGQNAQKASAAMYQLSQALGAGVMRKEDWKSIQNASMDTKEFRQQAIEAAIALGTLKKTGEDTYQALTGNKKSFHINQFAENLTEGQWFTSDVMMKVYQKYATASDQMKKAIDKMDDDYELTMTAGQMIKGYDALKKGTWDQFLIDEEIDDKKAAESLKAMISEFDEFGISTFRAGQEYRTFNDTIDATKDAVSTKWMNIMETLIGNIDQQKALWTTIGEKFYDWFAAPLDELQDMLNRWVDKGGRESLWNALGNIGKAIGAITKPIKDAFHDIFPPMTAKRLVELTKNFETFTSKLIIGEKTAERIKIAFKGVFSVIKTGFNILKTFASALFKIVGAFAPLLRGATYVAEALGKFADKAATTIRNSNFLANALNKLVGVIKAVVDGITGLIKETLKFDRVVGFFKGLFTFISKMGQAIGKVFASIIRNGDLNEFMRLFNGGLLSGLLIMLNKTSKKVKDLAESGEKFVKTFKGIFEDIRGILQTYKKEQLAKIVLTLAESVAILAGAMWLISTIDDGKLISSVGAIGLLMSELMVCFAAFTKLAKDQKILARSSLAIIGISTSMLILASAMNKISSLNLGQVATSLVAIAGAMFIMVKTLNKLPDSNEVKKKTTGLIGISISLLITAKALQQLAKMSIGESAKAIVIMGASLLILTKTLNKIDTTKLISKSFGLINASLALIVLGGAMKILATMSWSDIGRSLTAMAGALGILTIALNVMNAGNKTAIKMGKFSGLSGAKMSASSKQGGSLSNSFALLGATTALVILGGAMKILGTMSWSDIGRSLTAMAGALTILVAAVKILGKDWKSAFSGAGALLLISNSLIVFGLGMKILGSLSWGSILKSLASLAGVLLTLGIAAKIFEATGLTASLLGIAGAVALFGVACLAIGAGLTMIAAGISALALALSGGVTAIVAGITSIILGVAELIPDLIKIAGTAIKAFCEVIIECAPLIAKAVGTVILETVKMFADYVPMIAQAIYDLLINTIRVVADRMPELVIASMELIQNFFKGFVEALDILDMKTILEGSKCLLLLTGALITMASLAVLAPAAAVGIIAFGLLVSELGIVLSTLGKMVKSGSDLDNINKAGDLLQSVGTAIGKFIGGLISGFGEGVTKSLPNIADNLSEFMKKLSPFIEGVKQISPDTLAKISLLSGGILILTAANFLNGLGNLLSLGNSLPKMGKQLSDFMNNAQDFINGAYLISPSIMKSVNALASAIVAITGAQVINGIAKFITGGDKSFTKFGEDISSLGTSMNKFSKNLGTFSDKQVQSVTCAANAIAALANASKKIPNEGGWAAKILGDNSIGQFSAYLPDLGTNMSKFVTNLGSFGPQQIESVVAASQALVHLAEASKKIPNEGGVWGWLAGDNSIGQFSDQLPEVGKNLAAFGESLKTFTADQAETMGYAGQAIANLANAASQIPNSGGLVSLFTGDNDISVFAFKLPIVGGFLKQFIKNLGKFDKGCADTSKFAGESIAALANAASKIPNSCGLVNLFTGDNDISKFANKFPGVGTNLKDFVSNLGTFTTDQVTATECAGNAIVALATAASKIPDEGLSLSRLFNGEKDISSFSSKFPSVATHLAKFVENLGTFSNGQVTTTDCAGRAIQALGDAASKIPDSGASLKQLFVGEKDISAFAGKFPGVGTNLAKFAENLGTFTNDEVKTVECAGQAISKLASAANEVPNTGGLWQWLAGEKNLSTFTDKLPDVAWGVKKFSEKLGTFGQEQIDSITAATEALKRITYFGNDIKDVGALEDKADGLADVASGVKKFIEGLANISSDKAELAKSNAQAFYDLCTQLASFNIDSMSTLADSMKTIGENTITKFIDAFSGDNPKTKVSQAIRDLVDKMIQTAETKRSDLEGKFDSLANGCADKLKTISMQTKMKEAGKYFAQGFADGINENRYLAVDAGSALGNAAYNAAKKAIDAHSPSKKAHKLGNFFGQGFVNGILEYGSETYKTSEYIADQAKKGLTRAIDTVNNLINGDMTNRPTIRPVLDLTDVQSGANSINGMFNNMNVGAKLNAISTGINAKLQNGANSDLISAIKDLGSNLGGSGDTYNINGVTYDDQSGISDAVRTLIRAANIERRT